MTLMIQYLSLILISNFFVYFSKLFSNIKQIMSIFTFFICVFPKYIGFGVVWGLLAFYSSYFLSYWCFFITYIFYVLCCFCGIVGSVSLNHFIFISLYLFVFEFLVFHFILSKLAFYNIFKKNNFCWCVVQQQGENLFFPSSSSGQDSALSQHKPRFNSGRGHQINLTGRMAEWSIAVDCKSIILIYAQVRILLLSKMQFIHFTPSQVL